MVELKANYKEECHMTKANFGVVGMAVMGRNLALNIESRATQLPFLTVVKKKQKMLLLAILIRTLCQAMISKAS